MCACGCGPTKPKCGCAPPTANRSKPRGDDLRFPSLDNIPALNTDNFDEFIASKEKAFVMFYNPCNPEGICPAQEFVLAAGRSYRPNHAYASVNCNSSFDLCCRQDASPLPVFKVFSNGFESTTIKCAKNITADQMHMSMIMAPVLTKPRINISSPGR